MKAKINLAIAFVLALAAGATLTMAPSSELGANAAPHRAQDLVTSNAAAGDPCVAAHSTTRALYATYTGPLYQVLRHQLHRFPDTGCSYSLSLVKCRSDQYQSNERRRIRRWTQGHDR